MRINATKTSVTWPMTHAERDLAQAEADDWQSEFIAALHGMHTPTRTNEEGDA